MNGRYNPETGHTDPTYTKWGTYGHRRPEPFLAAARARSVSMGTSSKYSPSGKRSARSFGLSLRRADPVGSVLPDL